MLLSLLQLLCSDEPNQPLEHPCKQMLEDGLRESRRGPAPRWSPTTRYFIRGWANRIVEIRDGELVPATRRDYAYYQALRRPKSGLRP